MINYSGAPELQDFHGKAIALDIRDHYAPFPPLFIIHEYRVRGYNPFKPLNPVVHDGTQWQSWIESDSVWDKSSQSFKRNAPSDNCDPGITVPVPRIRLATTIDVGEASSGTHTLAPLNDDTINETLTVTRAMPSWKTCVEEGTR